MIIDAQELEPGTKLHADVCIVGSGAAGIPLALDLCERGLTVILLESGDWREDPEQQALYEGKVEDEALHSPLHKYRHRRFGGSTAIWGGRCVPLDPVDFEQREHIPLSGWPISYGEVARYYPEANTWAEAGACEYSGDKAFDPASSAMFVGFSSDRVSTDTLERFSCPSNFATRYRRRMELAQGLRVVLRASCTHIRLRAEGDAVQEILATGVGGRKFMAAAARFVLAAGGLETPRLLLASRDVHPQGIGNRHDVVGRYYMCHIAGNVGLLKVEGPLANVRHGYLVSPEGIYCRRRISLTGAEQNKQQVGNMVARLHFPRITDPAHRNGVLSGLFLAKHFISYEYGKRLNDGVSHGVPTYAAHLFNVATSPLYTAEFLLHWLHKRTLAERKFPSVILKNLSNRFSLEINAEQRPLAHSRVRLDTERDAHGTPRLHVDWRYDKADIDSVRRSLDVMAEEFRRSGGLEFTYDPTQLEEDLVRFGALGGHHIGTTRMGLDPQTSVVDTNCKVHDVHNLYIASSSVFPTSSQANPTLHIIAMSLRLSEHLAASRQQAAASASRAEAALES